MPTMHCARSLTRAAHRLLAVVAMLWSSSAAAQRPEMNYFHRADMPPGIVGQQQLLRNPLMAGYLQPVEFRAPSGVRLSPMIDGAFGDGQPGPVLAGMQVGHVYSLKITHIPFRPGAELYPTVEIVNRLYPPPGMELRHPVPVELTREELEMALDGQFVTRVIYLEDSSNPLPHADDPTEQRFIEVGPQEDPLFVADRLGRPMAILRMGSRVPAENEGVGVPGLGSPPIELYEVPSGTTITDRPTDPVDRAVERHDHAIPRTAPQPSYRRMSPPFANPYQR